MPNANTTIGLFQLGATLRQFPINFNITVPANGTYDVMLETPYAFSIDSIIGKMESGTCTIETRIDNVAVTVAGPATTMAMTSSKNTKATSSTNQVGDGSRITLVVSAISSPVNLAISYHCTRNA